MRRKRINIILTSFMILLFLGACASSKRTNEQSVENEPVITETITLSEKAAETIEKPAETTATVQQQIASPKAVEADEQVWSSILLRQEENGQAEKEKTNALDKVDQMFAEVNAERVSEPSSEDNIIEETECVETETTATVEEETEPVETETAETPAITILDETETESVDSFRISGEELESTIKYAEPEVSIETETTTDGRILYGDTTATGPSWLYSYKEKNGGDTSTINVSVYETPPVEEDIEDSIKPEDIIALSDIYKADRELQKAVTEMTTGEIYDKIMAFLERNYQYVFLAFALLFIILLIKVLAKHLQSDKKKRKEKIKGPEFKEEETNVYTLDPTQESFKDLLQAKQKDEDYDENEDSAERDLRPLREKAFTINDNDTVTIGYPEDSEEDMDPELAFNLSTMALTGDF